MLRKQSSKIMKFHTIWTVAVLFGILCKGFAPQRFLLSKSTSYPSILKSTYDGGGSQFYDDFGDSQSQFFDDFGDSLIGSSPDSSGLFMDSLQAKMVQTREVEAANEAKLSKNWRTGNWSVRGFSLAKEKTSQYNEDEQRGVVHVSSVAAPMSASLRDMSVIGGNELPERRTVAVGRTDGSVFLVRLGEAYLTKFASTPKLVENSKGEDFSVRIEDQWVEQAQIRPDEQEKLKPFKVLHNFQSSETGERCHSIAYYDIIEDDNDGYICTASGDSDVIKLFTLPRAGEQIQCNTLTGGHQSTVVSLKTMVLQSNNREELHLLISASKDGIISFWDLSKRGQLLLSCQSIDDRNKDALLTCLDVYNPSISKFYGYEPNEQTYLDMVFVGLTNGYVLGYAMHVILSSGECSSPDIAFRAHGADSGNGQGVTAIKCGGDGTIKNDSSGSRPNISSSTLLTGGDDGSVKQWEILSQNTATGTRMEHWPRIATQRMKNRAHVFSPGHTGPVTALSQQSQYDSSTFLSCGQDGSVSIWDAKSGKLLYSMDGFTSTISSLECLERDLLVTDGMDDLVCIHDFSVDEDEAENGYELDW